MGTSREQKRKRLKQVERWLRACFPPGAPVRVSCVGVLPDRRLGGTEFDDSRFRVRVLISGPTHEAIETLNHEWAHVLTDPFNRTEEEHPDTFWLVYGQIYRRWLAEGQVASRQL